MALTQRSHILQILTTFEDWTAAVDSGYGIDIIHLDNGKAFDTVPHLRLIKKL